MMPIMNETVKKLVDEYGAKLVEDRRWLHAHPELSFKEFETSKWVRSRLDKAGIPVLSGISGNSVVGVLEGEGPGPAIGLRADMDALGLTEENDLPYKSSVSGVMHACGHDAHTAALVALAEIFSAHRELIRGRIYFIFQQGEEFLPGGAVQLCADGVMKNIDYIFGWHCDANHPVGSIDLAPGARTAAVGTYDIKITGRGGHGSMPQQANNPIIPASELVSAINLIPALKCDPIKSCTISTSYLLCGVEGVANVIPSAVSMGGNIRSLDTEVRDFAMKYIEKLANGICAAHGCECKVTMVYGYPASVIDQRCFEVMDEAARELGLRNIQAPPSLGAEDFAYYGMEKPAGFCMFGMADPSGAHKPTPHHNPYFYIDDEKGLPLALEYMLTVYLKAVETLPPTTNKE
jgi:amidohydrolase